MGEFCSTETDGRLLIVTITRPEVMNALHGHASVELAAVWDDFEKDDDLWVAIITGEGERAFSAGNDLKFQAAGGRAPGAATGFAGLTNRYTCDKPIIAAVNGVAMGGGFEIALACDLIIASDNARFALPEPRVGLAALAGGLHRLPRQIGLKRALGMMLTGRHVSAQEGFELGFVNQVVPQADLMATARSWADQILELSPLSIRATKQVAYAGFDHASLQEAQAASYPAVATMAQSEDYIEGPVAFSEKRPPNWKGK